MNITRRMFLRGAVASAAIVAVPAAVSRVITEQIKQEPVADLRFGRYENVRYIESPAPNLNGGEVMPGLWSEKLLSKFYESVKFQEISK